MSELLLDRTGRRRSSRGAKWFTGTSYIRAPSIPRTTPTNTQAAPKACLCSDGLSAVRRCSSRCSISCRS